MIVFLLEKGPASLVKENQRRTFFYILVCIRSFFLTFLGQSQFKYASILNSEFKLCFGNVQILLVPEKLDIIHHLGTIEPWHELTKQSRLNLLSTCVIDRASIFANHNKKKIPMKKYVSVQKLTKT